MRIRGWVRNLEIAMRFLGRILGLDQGSIILNNGDHVVFIPTDCTPHRVHLSFTVRGPADGTQVCQGDLDYFSVTLAPGGFNLFAKVRSDAVTVVWVAIEDWGDFRGDEE
jgi:hypothetical protein